MCVRVRVCVLVCVYIYIYMCVSLCVCVCMQAPLALDGRFDRCNSHVDSTDWPIHHDAQPWGLGEFTV